MKLSSRLRPDVEAAPWVIEEVKKLEVELAEAYRELQLQVLATGHTFDWRVYKRSQDARKLECNTPAPASHVPFAAGTLAVCTELGAQLAESGPRVFQKHPELQERCQQMLDDCANRETNDD